MTTHLVSYVIAQALPLPPIQAAMYEYILAANGLFIHGQREGLQAMLPVAACTVRGLVEVQPFVHLEYPRVTREIVECMLDQAREAKDAQDQPVEIVFHLSWSGANWQLEVPAQEQHTVRVQPLGPAMDSSYARALIEMHSHANYAPEPSRLDDEDETGFRIFSILGTIFTRPSMRVRVGIYGYRWEIPTTWIFDLPEEITDCVGTNALS